MTDAHAMTRRKLLKTGSLATAGAMLPGCAEEETTGAGDYQANIASLEKHQTPEWFRDAKFGVFIHWGLYSIPAYAPDRSVVPAGTKAGSHDQFKYNAYAEWYQNSLAFEDGPTARYHREHFGTQGYASFAEPFNAMLEQWDPQAWAKSIGVRMPPVRSAPGYLPSSHCATDEFSSSALSTISQ